MENQIKNTFDKYKRTVVHTVDLEVQKKLLEHLLLDCVHLDNSRQEFLFDVGRVLGMQPSNIQEALGMRVKSHARRGKIARILYEFLCNSNLHM
jgi:hypothetical protein